MERKNAVAVITARGGSKRIPHKNIKEFCLKNDVNYTGVEEAWLDFNVKGKLK